MTIRVCPVCERESNLTKGRCPRCYRYFKIHGVERAKGLDRKETAVRGENHYAWKGDDAGRSTKRVRAHRIYPLGPCERCGKPATDRHHRDDDTGNNAPSNIMILCRRCHMVIDGRLAALIAMAPTAGRRTVATPCVHCGKEYKPLRKGFCAACSQYQRVHGEPRPLDGSFKPKRKSLGGNAGKTCCIHGHEFNEANTYIDKRGRRLCRACGTKRAAERRAATNALIAGETGSATT